MPAWGALIGAGAAGLASAFGSRSAGAAQSRYERKTKKAGRRWEQILRAGLPRVEATLRERESYLERGYNTAQREVSRIGQGSRRRVLERGESTLGNIGAGLKRRGILDTTIFDQARRGVYDDTERALLDIDERLAGIRSSIETARTRDVGTAIGQRADFGYRSVQDFADIQRSLMSYYGNRQVAASPGLDLGGLAELAGSLKDLFK